MKSRTTQEITNDIEDRKFKLEIAQEGYAEAENAYVRSHYERACGLEYDSITKLEEELNAAFAAEENES